jgi:two-component system sensor histidine kinase PilS (NtrC family)
VRLASVVEEALLLLEDSGELNGNFHVEGNFKASNISYFGNINQFKQIFWNLIRSALKAAPEDGTITIDIEQDTRERVLLKIADTGNNLKDEEREKLIEPVLSSEFQSGTGIGMAVVRRIVDDYNGTIHVRPNREKGTEIMIVLPRLQVKPDSRMRL